MMRPVLSLALLVPALACRPSGSTAPDHAPAQPEPVAATPSEAELAAAAETRRNEVLAASNLPDPLDAPVASDPMQTTVHRLSNGLTVYISTDRQEPRFNAWIAVRTGSRNDPSDSTGLAHYLEHMLFKGTDELGTSDFEAERPHIEKIAELYRELRSNPSDERKQQIFAEIDAATVATAKTAIPNEFDNLYRELGISGVNAFTSNDQTVYVANVPSNRVDAWARVESERFQDVQFRLFYPELEAVYEEKNRSMDNPDWRVWESLRKSLFPEHPYGTQPTIGTVEHLKVPAYGDMQDYFAQFYQPNNVAIVLAGDIDAKTALPVLEKHFGSWQPNPIGTPEPAKLTPLTSRVETTVVAPGEQSVMVSWPTVAAGHADEAALEVMDYLVDNSSTGLLNLNLILSQKLPAGGSGHEAQLEAGHWILEGTAREGQSLQEVESLLMTVVDDLKSGRFREEDLDAVILNAEIRLKRLYESNSGRVRAMANAYIQRQAWPDAARHIEKLKAVTRQDVIRVANAYLGEGRAVVFRERGPHNPPKITKPKITPLPIDPSRHSSFYDSVVAMPATAVEPRWLVEGQDYYRSESKTGQLLAVPNARNDLFSVRYSFDVGSRRRPLLCHAVKLANQSGTEDHDAANFRRQLHALGTQLNASCDADRTTIQLSGIDRNLEASVKLVNNWVKKLAPQRDTVKGLRDNTISRRRDQMDDPRQLARALDAYAIYGKRSPQLAVPSNRKIAGASARSLAREFASLADYQHRTYYYGPRKASELGDAVALGKGRRPLKDRDARKYRRVKKPTIFFVDKKSAQAQVRVLVPHDPVNAEQRAAIVAANSYLGGGMGGLIFQEMREARGLAYSAFASYDAGVSPRDESGLRGYIGTQVDKTPEALNTMLELLAAPIQADRLGTALRAVEQQYRTQRIAPRRIAGAVETWDERGEKADPRPREREAVRVLTPEALDAFNQSMKGAPVIISIVADKERLDLDALSKLAEIKEVKVDDLFGFGKFPKTAKAATSRTAE